MKHYEIVFMVHPDQSERVPAMIESYTQMITQRKGTVDRLEDWGRRPLAYPINKVSKAHYVLMNVTCDQETLKELTDAFRYNDAVIRYLVTNVDTIITEPSCMLKERDNRSETGFQEPDFDGRKRDTRKPRSFDGDRHSADEMGTRH